MEREELALEYGWPPCTGLQRQNWHSSSCLKGLLPDVWPQAACLNPRHS